MIEYLEKLVDDGEYRDALACADKILLGYDNSPQDLVALHCAVLKSRYMLNDFHGALVSGQLAIRLAEDVKAWDYFGTSCFYTGIVWDRLGQPEQALYTCYLYLHRTSEYHTAKHHETLIWYNMGVFHSKALRGQEAILAFEKGLALAIAKGQDRWAHGIRHGLIQAHIIAGNLAQVPRLLAKSLHYLRHHPDTPDHKQSLLCHFELRADFAVMTQRHKRATSVAKKGLRLAHGHSVNQFYLHMICARVAAISGQLHDAIGHALAARVHAIQMRRYELEGVAAEFLYEVAKVSSESIHSFAGVNFFPRLEDLTSENTELV